MEILTAANQIRGCKEFVCLCDTPQCTDPVIKGVDYSKRYIGQSRVIYQSLEDKLKAFLVMAKDLADNHHAELNEVGMDIENISANISIGIRYWNEYHNEKEHAGDDTMEETQRKDWRN